MFNAVREQHEPQSRLVAWFVGATALVIAVLVIASASRTAPSVFREADQFHETYNSDDWHSLVQAGIEQKCAFMGMDKSDVIAALGSPGTVDHNQDGSEIWTYMLPDLSTCASYGDKGECRQRQLKQELVSMTPRGHKLKGATGPGCQAQVFASLR